MDVIAVGYGRTSKEKEDGFSLDGQFEAIRRVAADAGITLPPEFEFREEFSGRLLERPKLNALRALLREGKAKAVIIYATDRLSRKLGGADILLDEFFAHEVKLYIVSWGTYVRNTPEDRLRFNFEATFSDFERRKIAERMNRGKKDKLSQGIYLGDGNSPYGYRKIGHKKEMRLEIIEEEAAVIRQIYHWYALDHVPVPEITRRLHGTPTPAESKGVNFPHKVREAGDWAEGTVYLILRNVTYAGTLNKWHTTINVPAIVEPGLYTQARERMTESKKHIFPAQRYEYLMNRRLRCSYCDYSISPHPRGGRDGKTTLYYCCPSRRSKSVKPKCSLPRFLVHIVDTAVWEWVRALILNPESLRVILEESQKEQQQKTHDLKYQLTRIQDRLSAEERRLAIILREYADIEARSDTSPAAAAVREVYRQTKEQSEALFRELTEERDTLRSSLAEFTIDEALIDGLFTLAQAVREDIDNLPFPKRRELIESLNVRGELAFEGESRVLYILWYTHRFRKVLA
jgi:site-specific DNA recombinase